MHPWTKYDGITSFNELKAFAEATSDSTLSCIVEVVEERKEQIPDFLKKMKSRIAVGAGLSTERVITLSTIHSAKGMDWTAVRIENDFSVGFNAATGFITKVNKSTEEELNMLYVAVTRAKRLLHPPTLLRELYPTLNVLRPLSAVSTHAASEQTRRLAVECNAKGIPVPANPPPVQLKCRQCEHHALPDAFDMNGPRPNNLPLVCRPSTHPAATKHNASIMTIPLPDTFAGTSTSSSSASSAAAVAAAAAKSASMDDVDILSAPLDQYNPPVVYGSFPAAALPECLCSACGNQSVHIYRLLGPFPDPNTHPAATATAAPTTPPLVHLPPL